MTNLYPVTSRDTSSMLCLTLCFMLCQSWVSCHTLQADDTLQMIDGTQTSSTIESVSPDGAVVLSGSSNEVSLDKIVAYQTDKQPVPSGSFEVLIIGGSKIFTDSVEIQGSDVAISSPAGLSISLPLDVVQAIVFKSTELVAKQLANRSDSNDTVVVGTPDGEKVVSGIFEGLTQGKLGLNFNGKSRKIGVEKIHAVSLADLGLNVVSGTQIELTDGSLLNGSLQSVENGTLTLALTSNRSIQIPWASVDRLEMQSDNLVYLSSLNPIAVQQKSIFAPQRLWQRDLSVEANPIRLNHPEKSSPQIFRKGIGTQSYSELEFANTNQFERFQAITGIDAETQGRGDCQMSVYADGIKLWSQRVTAETAPQKVDVDISGMATVTLVVEPGKQFDLADHADWADAKFVKP